MALKVLGYYVLIKPDSVEQEHEIEGTDIKLYLVEDERVAKAGINTGTIISIGPLAWKDYNKNYTKKPWAKEGDYVLYSKYGGKKIIEPTTKEELVLVSDGDILCKIVN